MKHHQLPLPKKDHRQAQSHSRSKYTVKNKKSRDISKECLDNYLLTTASENASSESLLDNTEVFLFSEEIDDGGQILEASNNFMNSPIPRVSPSSSSSAITAYKDEAGKISSSDSNCGMSRFLEAEIVINHLREARVQIMNSVNVDGCSKSIVDALIDMVISNLDAVPEDNKDRLPKSNLVTGKTHILLILCPCVTWILVTFMFLLFSTRGPRSFTEPPPT